MFYSYIGEFLEFINNRDDDDDDSTGDYNTSILCRWGKCVDVSPQTADELNYLKTQKTLIYGGSDQSNLSKKMQGKGDHWCYEKPIPGKHATRERGQESVSLACTKQRSITNFRNHCVVCVYKLVHSKENMKMIRNVIKL